MKTFFNKNFWIGLTYSYIGYVCGDIIFVLSEIERGSIPFYSLTFGGAILGSYIHTLLSKRKKNEETIKMDRNAAQVAADIKTENM